MIELQRVKDNLIAFYGMVDDQIDSENVRNIIKAGKRIERIDIYARLGASKKELEREVCRMIPRIERSSLSYNMEKIAHIQELLEEPQLDYYEIVREIDAIV